MAIKTYRRIAAGIILALTIAGATAIMLVPRLLDLDSYRAQILSWAQQALNRRVSYESASFSWNLSPSFVFRGITIKEKSGDTPFLQVGQLTFTLALIPLLHNEMRLREIVVERPVLMLDRNRAGVFNFDDLFAGKPSQFKIHLKSVRIKNGRILFTDRFIDPKGFTASLENLDLRLSRLARGKTAEFKLSAMIPDENGDTAVSFAGTAHIPAQEESLRDTKIDMTLSAKNIDTGRYWPYYGPSLPFERVRGSLDIESAFTGKLREFTTKGSLRIRALRFAYPRVFPAVLTPKEVRLAYDVERTPRDLSVKSFDLTVDELRVKGSCALGDIHTEDPRITARAATSPFRLEEFRQYIPYGVIVKGTADFIERHITGGVYQLDEGKLDGRVSQILHMERGDNYNVLFIRGRVEKGLVAFGPQIPTFNNIKGDLEMRGKDFQLRGMTGNFGGSPFTAEGKIAGYPLDTPASYPFTMTMTPGEAEVAWLLRQKKSAEMAFSGPSLLRLSGSGTAADYRIAGSWDLSRADYRYQQLVQKQAGIDNRLSFNARLGNGEARLENCRYVLPPLDVTANATYRYNDREPLAFAVTTNRFMVNPDLPLVSGLRKYHPSGELQATVSGSGNPAVPDGIRLRGAVTVAEFSLRPFEQMKPLSRIAGTIHLTETALETAQLTGRVGDSPFAVEGRVAGRAHPTADLVFSSPQLHLEDFGFHAPGPVPEVNNLSGRISLKERNLAITSLSGELAQSKFSMSGEVLTGESPAITLQVDFPYLRVEDMAPLTRLKRAGADEEQNHKITLQARATSAAGSVRDIPFEHLDSALALDNDRLDIQSLSVGVFGGIVTGTGKADFAADGGPMYQAHYRLDHVDAAQLQSAAGMERQLTGLLATEGELTFRGNNLEDLKNTAQGVADITLTDGVMSIPATGELKTAREIAFKRVQTHIAYTGKVLDIRSAGIEAFGGFISGNGAVDFSAPDGPGYRIDCRLANIDAAAFFRALDATRDISGRLALQIGLTASGDSVAAVKRTARGSVTVHLEKGVVNRFGFISKVFSVLNVSQLLDFRLPDLVSKGMPYDRIDGTYSLHDGTVTTRDLTMHSPSLNMTIVGNADIVNRVIDVKIGVQPLQTVGKVVNRIPIIGWILTGGKKRFLVAFYEAKGNWDDPTVTSTSMTSLPRGIYNIFERALNLPDMLISNPGKVILGK